MKFLFEVRAHWDFCTTTKDKKAYQNGSNNTGKDYYHNLLELVVEVVLALLDSACCLRIDNIRITTHFRAIVPFSFLYCLPSCTFRVILFVFDPRSALGLWTFFKGEVLASGVGVINIESTWRKAHIISTLAAKRKIREEKNDNNQMNFMSHFIEVKVG